MKLLLTGGAGYIGSHVARELRDRGHEVVIFDNLSTGHRRLAAGFPLVVGDIRAREQLVPALRGCNAVLHFAALSNVSKSCAQPAAYFDNNVGGGLSLLECMREAGVDSIIFSSTCAVYGLPQQPRMNEQHPRAPVNPYGASKLTFELALESYAAAYGLRFVALRYFNAAGAHPSGEIGEMHHPESHLLPIAIEAALGYRPQLQVFGDDYPTPDGTCVRDYLHVSDLAVAHALAIEQLREGTAEYFNLGTGRGHSVREVIGEVSRVLGSDLPHQVTAPRAGDPPSLVADPTKAERVLGWKARHDLGEMIASAAAWAERVRAKA